uniref:C2H2-type domain-containing protein n=1 Tax=Oreochromis niloticus TaxID=8128 RepID=A0A669BQ87_ORENI
MSPTERKTPYNKLTHQLVIYSAYTFLSFVLSLCLSLTNCSRLCCTPAPAGALTVNIKFNNRKLTKHVILFLLVFGHIFQLTTEQVPYYLVISETCVVVFFKSVALDFPQQDCKDENPLVLKQDTETFPAHEESDHSDLEPSSDQLLSQNPLDTDQDESKESYRNKSEQIVSGLKVQNHKTAHLCSTCGKKCNKMEKLNRHEQIHTGEKPRSCSICGKRFSQKSHSKQHMPVHTGEKLHSCGTCGKRFSRKSVLTRHMLIHTGEKQHSCRICGNGFSRKEHLNRHMEFHTNEKQYSCSTRGKRFNVKSNLNIHMRIRKGKNIYSQRAVEETHVRNHTCGKQFSSSVQLKMHI